MPRHRKRRRVGYMPSCTIFKPAGIPAFDLDEQVLRIEELESLRLKDLLDLDQEECADRMGVSRPTFQRVLNQAHKKVAAALVQGMAIRIEGGQFEYYGTLGKCHRCEFSRIQPGIVSCPKCGTSLSREPQKED